MVNNALIVKRLEDAHIECANLRAFLRALIRLALELTGAAAGSVFIFDHGSSAAKSLEKVAMGSAEDDLKTIEEAEALARRRLSLSFSEAEPRCAPQAQWDSDLTVPLVHLDVPIGTICVRKTGGGQLQEQDEERLRALAREAPRLIKRMQFAEWMKGRGLELRLIGGSQAMIRIEHLVQRFSRSDCPVLISGETGTGKELIAHAIHFYSPRNNKPFVVVNCGAFASDDLLASELFGHAKGAFTDAKYDKPGKFELADGGTIFLDEVSCMKPAMQALLLRVLRYGEIQKVGDRAVKISVDVRVIAATNQDLKELSRKGYFREDLYSRLKGVEVGLPQLKDRKEDIPLLVKYFIEKYARKDKLMPRAISEQALSSLLSYDWPDNVAGLENAIHYALLISDSQEIQLRDLPAEIWSGRDASGYRGEDGSASIPRPAADCEAKRDFMPLADKLRQCERDYILQALESNNWNISRTAKVLGLTRQGLQKKMRRHRLREALPERRERPPATSVSGST